MTRRELAERPPPLPPAARVRPPLEVVAPAIAAPRRRRRRWPWLLALPLLAGGLWFARPRAAAPLPAIDSTVVTRGPLVVAVLETGKVEPAQQAQIRSRVGGVVQEVLVKEGQDVKKGELLLQVDPTDAEREAERTGAALEEAEAQLRLASWRHRSSNAGVRAKVVARADLHLAQNEFILARARLKSAISAHRTALDQVRYTRVTAPFAGRVIARHVQPGEVVVAGMTATVEGRPVLVLADMSALTIKVDLNQIDFARVQLGHKARVTLDSLPGRHFTATVVGLAASSSAGAGGSDVLPARLTFDAGQALSAITPGMVADVEIEVAKRSNALLLPIEAVGFKNGQRIVHAWSEQLQAFEPRNVSTGEYNERHIEVTEGLREGARVRVGVPTEDPGGQPTLF